MGILSFEIPKKLRTTTEHNTKYSSDSGISGTYVSNMSIKDKRLFKAKHIKGAHERIEIRVEINGINCNIFVYKSQYNPANNWHNNHNDIKISMNGKLDITMHEWDDIQYAIKEAKTILNK